MERSAAAASSALISRRESRSRTARRASAAEAFSTAVLLSPDQRVDAATERGIGEAQLPFHLTEVSSRSEEALEEGHLVAVEPTEAPHREAALERRSALRAIEARDGKLVRADRAGGDDVMRHTRDLAPGGGSGGLGLAQRNRVADPAEPG